MILRGILKRYILMSNYAIIVSLIMIGCVDFANYYTRLVVLKKKSSTKLYRKQIVLFSVLILPVAYNF